MEARLILVALVMAGAAAGVRGLEGEMAELARMLRDSCAGETGVDLGLVDEVNKGAKLMPDPKLKCYIKCIMETAGMMGEGAVDVEAVVAMLPDELRAASERHVRACDTRRGADDCDTAFLTHVCWQDANKEAYFLI